MKNAASISSLGLPVVIVLVVAFKFLVNRVDKKRAGFKCEWCESKEDLRVWDYTLESKVNQVIQQLKEGRAKVVFDLTSETCNIVPNEGKFHV